MPYVHTGKYLRVDLSASTISEHTISDDDVRKFLLGSGYAAKLYYEEMDPNRPWDDPASPLYAFNGLLGGTFAPTACRSSWCARSPLTGIFAESNMGGHWSAELRFAGYDGIVVTGRADRPVYLWIDGTSDTIEIRDASHLWGLNHYEFHDRVLEETDAKARMACIGQAGENLVRYAGVVTGGIAHARTAGRTGMGAVMGVKRLKAIVVRGKDRPQYHDAKAFRDTVKEGNASIKEFSKGMSVLGTAGGVPGTEQYGDLPLSNWRGGTWDKAYEISGQKIAETIFERHTFCFACPIGCGKTVQIEEGPYAGTRGHGPEYETLGGFGGALLNSDLNSIAHINMLCNDYGLDTISTSGCIAFAMEAIEKGLLGTEQLAELGLDPERDAELASDLTWGNAEAIVACLHKIALREGLGDFLADGVRAMAEALGPEARAFALHVKGLEMPYHDPRAFVSMAANYATANRGACHLESLSYWEGYGVEVPDLVYWPDADHWTQRLDNREGGQMTVRYQDYNSVYNPLGLCKFIIKGHAGPQLVADLVNRALGWDWEVADVYRTGERIFNLKRLINLRHGISAADDTLPGRFLFEPRPAGGAAGSLPDFEPMMAEYYAARGWHPASGVPNNDRLQALDLA